jgi:hypothetical protein
MPAPVYAYTTPEAVAAVLTTTLDTDATARVLELIHDISAEINDVTGRVFTTTGTTETPVTRTFDAVPGPVLAVPDLQSVSSVTVYGVALDPTEYEILPYDLIDPAPRRYRQIRRLAAGVPYPWWVYNALGPAVPYRAVQIAGIWGEDPPPVVAQVALEATVRAWHAEQRQYSDPVAGAEGRPVPGPGPALTADHKARLAPYGARQEVLFA